MRHPAHGLSRLFGDCVGILACNLRKHRGFAIALDELYWSVEVLETPKCFTRHRSWKHITADHDLVHSCLANILKDRLQCGEVPVNIVDGSDSHDRSSSLYAPAVMSRRLNTSL